MRRVAVFLLLAAAGCSDLELDLEIRVPEALKPRVAAIDLHVYVPPAGSPFSCAELELGRVDASTLRLAEAQVVRLAGRKEAPIRDVDRLSTNLFFAEVLDENETSLAFACARVDEFSDDVAIVLEAEPAVRLEIPADVSLSRIFDDPAVPSVDVRVLDVLDRPVAGTLVQWTVASGSGVAPPVSATTDAEGRVAVAPELPDRTGPIAVEVRARWAVGTPPILRGLVAPRPKMGTLQGIAIGAQVGRFGEGHDSIAALILGAGNQRRVELYDATSFSANPGALAPVATYPAGDATVLARLDHPGDELDRLVLLSTPGTTLSFTRIDPGGAMTVKTTERPRGANAIRKVLDAGACMAPGRPMLAIVFEGEVVARYDELGNMLSSETRQAGDADFSNGGCVGDSEGVPHRVLARTTPLGISALEIEAGGTSLNAQWFGPASEINYAPPIGGPELMIAGRVETNDLTIARGRLRLDETPARIEVLGTDRLPAIPVVSYGIDADGDKRLDIVSLLTPDATSRGVRRYDLFESAAVEFAGERISGSITVAEDLCYTTAFAGDFDGDGNGDVVVAETTRILCGSFEMSRAFFYEY